MWGFFAQSARPPSPSTLGSGNPLTNVMVESPTKASFGGWQCFTMVLKSQAMYLNSGCVGMIPSQLTPADSVSQTHRVRP